MVDRAAGVKWPGYPWLWPASAMTWNGKKMRWYAVRQDIPSEFVVGWRLVRSRGD